MKKILIVDDLEKYLMQLENLLEDYFECFTAKDMQSAREIYENNDIDIALVDIRLKDEDFNKDGLKLLEWIKEKSPDTPVVMISGYQQFDYAVDAVNLGADYFIKKPFPPDALVEKLKELTE